MNIQKINSNNVTKNQNAAFGNGFITLAVKNLGNEINQNVVGQFNKGTWVEIVQGLEKEAEALFRKINPAKDAFIKSRQDLVDKVDYFALAGGSGSRFVPLATEVGSATGRSYNKISLPIALENGSNLHMLDFAMGMGKYFTQNSGYEAKIAKEASGSFGDVVGHYLSGQNPIKDVVVSCGDNIFGASADEMTSFFTKVINDPKKQMALVGVKRTPEVVAKRFGVLGVEEIPGKADVMKLKSFAEKPDLADAIKLATSDGNNIANTGMFYISKEQMSKLISRIRDEIRTKGESTIIAKNAKEKFDFANALKLVHSEVGADASAVKVVKTWEDVGEPEAYYRFVDALKTGEFLKNFPPRIREIIIRSLIRKVDSNAILYTNKYPSLADVPADIMKAAKDIDGRKVIA